MGYMELEWLCVQMDRWDREDILFPSVPLGEGQRWQLLAHISSHERAQEVQRGQAGHSSLHLKMDQL